MKNIFLVLMILFFVAIPFSGLAAEFYSGRSYLLGSDEVSSSNLYVGAQRADVRGQVSGDLVLVGVDITVTGPIVEDAIVGGGTVKLMSPIEGDARVVAGTVSVADRIGGDVLIFGGTVSIEPTAEVVGDVIIYGGSVKILGPVRGGVRVIGGDVILDSSVAGDTLIQSERLVVGQKGVISGNLDYRSGNKNSLINKGKVLGKVKTESNPILPEERQIGTFLAALANTWLVLRILMSILGALVIYFLFRYRLTQAVGEALARPWRSLLVGFVVVVVTPVLVIVLLASVFGIMFAGVLLAAYFAVGLMAYILAGTYFGSWAYKLITKGSSFIIDWRTIILGTLGLTIISFVPVIGLAISFAFYLIALASLVERFYLLLTE